MHRPCVVMVQKTRFAVALWSGAVAPEQFHFETAPADAGQTPAAEAQAQFNCVVKRRGGRPGSIENGYSQYENA